MLGHIKQTFFMVFFSILICLGLSAMVHASSTADKPPFLDIYYFHNNPCDACHEDVHFMEKFNALVGEDRRGVNFNIYVEDIFKEKSSELFQQLCDKYDIPQEERKTPALFIGSEYIQGSESIDDQLKNRFLKAKADFLEDYPDAIGQNNGAGMTSSIQNSPAESTGTFTDVLKPAGGTDSTIVYFYVTACENCEKIKAMLKQLHTSYTIQENGKMIQSTVKIISYNAGEPKNLNLSKLYFQSCHIPEQDQAVPLLIIGNRYFSGGDTTLDELERVIRSGEGTKTPVQQGGTELQNRYVSLRGYSYAGIFMTGLVNGLNPCSLSMLLFFFSLLLAKGAQFVKYGAAFILGKFIAYLALGTIAYNLLIYMNDTWLRLFQSAVKVLLLAVVFLLLGMNLWDYFKARKENYGGIRLQLPARLRKMNHQWIQKMTSFQKPGFLLPMSLILGMVISVGEFLCTGQIYLATILYVLKSSQTFNLQAAASFGLYVLAMMIPLVIITVLIQKGKELFDLTEAIRSHLPLIKLINAVVFLLFAAIVLILF